MKSNLSRRSVLGILAGAAFASYDLDPERALYVPGQKTISIPSYDLTLSREELLDYFYKTVVLVGNLNKATFDQFASLKGFDWKQTNNGVIYQRLVKA
jgi:hypothetical protein